MSRLGDSIESEINAYWNAAASGTTPLPAISDSELGRLIDRIQDLDNSETPPEDLADRLMRTSPPPASPPKYVAPVTPIPMRAVELFDRPAPHYRKWAWLAAALIVALLGVAAIRWQNAPEEESVIPAAVSTNGSDATQPSGSLTETLAHLTFDPEALVPVGRNDWSAAAFRFYEIPAGRYFELPNCPVCSVLVTVAVTEGRMELRLDGPAIVSDQQSGDVHTWSSDESITVANGVSATFGLRSVSDLPRLTNTGADTATLLVGYLYGEDFSVDIGGGTPSSLYASLWSLPSLGEGAVTFEIDRLEIAPRGTVASASSTGAALYLLEQGKLSASMASGVDESKTWIGPIGVTLDQLPAGVYDLGNPGTEPTVVYRMSISSADASNPGQ